MIRFSRELELITPCFLGGAEPNARAEVRPASIRGQLRWWFRVLGGFKSLSGRGHNLRQQEDLIFGGAADADSHAGLITIRTSGLASTGAVRDDKGMDATIYNERGYLLFPLRATDQGRTSHARAVFNPDLQSHCPTLTLTLLWRGKHSLRNDLECLVQVRGTRIPRLPRQTRNGGLGRKKLLTLRKFPHARYPRRSMPLPFPLPSTSARCLAPRRKALETLPACCCPC